MPDWECIDEVYTSDYALRERAQKAEGELATLKATIGFQVIEKFQAEAARWQAVAIRERAIIIHIGYGDIEIVPSGDDQEIAAADLGCNPRAWLMSGERIKALEVMGNLRTEILCPECGAWMGIDDMKPYMAVLRAMLVEAGQ